MSPSPSSGPTAFVLAGGGTKGSFEVGALQYLVEVERITPDIVTATSAGAIAATVLAQARTHPEFVQRVGEIEDDVMAMTTPERVFGKQAWLGALDGTRLGREIELEFTEGTRPPFPLTSGIAPPVRSPCHPPPRTGAPDARPDRGPPASPAPRTVPPARGRRVAPAPGASPPAHERELGAQPRPAGAGAAPGDQRHRCRRSGADRPSRTRAPPGRHRLARRRPALRHRGRHPRRGRRPDARPGGVGRPGRPGRRRHGLGQRAHGLPAPLHGRRRLRRRRRARDRPGAGGRAARRHPHLRRRGAAPPRCPATSATTPTPRPATSACGPWA